MAKCPSTERNDGEKCDFFYYMATAHLGKILQDPKWDFA